MMLIMKITRYVFLFFMTSNLVVGAYSSFFKGDISDHLAQFSDVNQVHHENIDDEFHSHKHKHSEGEEEHEHNHEHSNVSHSEVKVINNSFKVVLEISIIESKQGSTEKNLLSNAHPLEIYRPPILV